MTYNVFSGTLNPTHFTSTCPHNMVNFGPLAAEIGPVVWGTPAIFNGFRVLAALLYGTPVLGVSQTLQHWTEGSTYIWQGSHHIGHRPIFLLGDRKEIWSIKIHCHWSALLLCSGTSGGNSYQGSPESGCWNKMVVIRHCVGVLDGYVCLLGFRQERSSENFCHFDHVNFVIKNGSWSWFVHRLFSSGRTEFETLEEVKRKARIARTFTRYSRWQFSFVTTFVPLLARYSFHCYLFVCLWAA